MEKRHSDWRWIRAHRRRSRSPPGRARARRLRNVAHRARTLVQLSLEHAKTDQFQSGAALFADTGRAPGAERLRRPMGQRAEGSTGPDAGSPRLGHGRVPGTDPRRSADRLRPRRRGRAAPPGHRTDPKLHGPGSDPITSGRAPRPTRSCPRRSTRSIGSKPPTPNSTSTMASQSRGHLLDRLIKEPGDPFPRSTDV